jgi:hypothetical protein
MQWNRSITIGLAKNSCKFCQGHGMRVQYKIKQSPCSCVFRSVFRVCLRRFRECALSESYASTVSWDYYAAGGRRVVSRKKEEFMADFCLIAKRTLTDLESRVFRYYFLLGADWKLCVRQMKIDRGLFFHTVYRVEEKLGRAFVETEPYALYPLDEYFGPPIRRGPSTAYISDPVAEREALRVPMLMTA